jgi:hypothetical protein
MLFNNLFSSSNHEEESKEKQDEKIVKINYPIFLLIVLVILSQGIIREKWLKDKKIPNSNIYKIYVKQSIQCRINDPLTMQGPTATMSYNTWEWIKFFIIAGF